MKGGAAGTGQQGSREAAGSRQQGSREAAGSRWQGSREVAGSKAAGSGDEPCCLLPLDYCPLLPAARCLLPLPVTYSTTLTS